MRHLIYLTSLFFVISCSKKKENTTQSGETEKTAALQESSPELELEVVNPNPTPPELKYEINGDKVVIIRSTGTADSFTIPDNIEGGPVTEIRARAFENCSSLATVFLPDSITSIG